MSMEHEFHSELKHIVARRWRERSLATFTEFKLPNGRIADIISYMPNLEIHIIEVKTTLKASMADYTILKYRGYANKLYIAAPDAEVLRNTQALYDHSLYYSTTEIGLIRIEGDIAFIGKECRSKTMSGDLYKYIQRKLLQTLFD